MLASEEHVYCTLCVNADVALECCEKAMCPKEEECRECSCYDCNCLDPEDSRTDRPKYQERQSLE